MNDILLPSFSDWLFDLLAQAAKWINMFDEAEDRGDVLEPDAKDEDEGDDDNPMDKAADGDKDPDDKDPGEKKPDEKKPDEKKPVDKKADDKKADDHMIPKFRYDSAKTRADAAEAANLALSQELETLKGDKPKPDDTPTFDSQMTEFDRQIEEARADNNIDSVIDLGKQQRALERAENTRIATDTSMATNKAAREADALDVVIDRLYAEYPALDDESDTFDQEIVSEILELQKGYMAVGKTPAQAMEKAAKLLVPQLVPETAAEIAKRKTDVKKNLSAANQQAPDSKDKGENSDKGGDLMDQGQLDNLTQIEFDAIPDETKRRLRGDIF